MVVYSPIISCLWLFIKKIIKKSQIFYTCLIGKILILIQITKRLTPGSNPFDASTSKPGQNASRKIGHSFSYTQKYLCSCILVQSTKMKNHNSTLKQLVGPGIKSTYIQVFGTPRSIQERRESTLEMKRNRLEKVGEKSDYKFWLWHQLLPSE